MFRCRLCYSELFTEQSPKFKRVLLKETPEFPFWDLNICVDFDLRDSKKMENITILKNKWCKNTYFSSFLDVLPLNNKNSKKILSNIVETMLSDIRFEKKIIDGFYGLAENAENGKKYLF